MKQKAPAWMALWVRDLLADTEELDAEEFGAYIRLLLDMWLRGGFIPDDDRIMARVTRVSRFKWRRLKPVLMGFLTRIDDRRLTQKRLLRELWLSRELSKKTARSVTLENGQQVLQLEGGIAAPRERARVQSPAHSHQTERSRLGLAREAAARGVLPPQPEVSDELRDLIKKMGLG